MDLANVAIRHYFPTPFLTGSLDQTIVAQVNPRLTKTILLRQTKDRGAQISNRGGWQSDDRLMEWGGDEAKIVLTALTQIVDHSTLMLDQSQGRYRPQEIDWKVSAWANVNHAGDINIPHSHPGNFWAAVYYVEIEDVGSEEMSGGELELIDPRGPLPMMYAPKLCIGIKGYEAAGKSELYRPRSGECVVFPAWLGHSVRPFTGSGRRISIAFNFSI